MSYLDENLVNGTYTYRITAIDNLGAESDPSSEASATVAVDPPSRPLNVTASSPARGGRIEVCWEAAGSGTVGYNIYRSTSSSGTRG